jgi:hypothetical protein
MERWKRRTRRGLALGTLAALGFLVSLAFTGIVLATDTSTSGSTATTTDSTPTTTETTPTTTETTPTTTQPPGGEGCTPGYWKNHLGSWPPTGYSPGQSVGSVFAAGGFPSLASGTLLDALQGGGGPGTLGAAQILLRAAVAALLNAAHPGVDYSMSASGVISAVNAALASNDRDTMLALATLLDGLNNAGCPGP